MVIADTGALLLETVQSASYQGQVQALRAWKFTT